MRTQAPSTCRDTKQYVQSAACAESRLEIGSQQAVLDCVVCPKCTCQLSPRNHARSLLVELANDQELQSQDALAPESCSVTSRHVVVRVVRWTPNTWSFRVLEQARTQFGAASHRSPATSSHPAWFVVRVRRVRGVSVGTHANSRARCFTSSRGKEGRTHAKPRNCLLRRLQSRVTWRRCHRPCAGHQRNGDAH